MLGDLELVLGLLEGYRKEILAVVIAALGILRVNYGCPIGFGTTALAAKSAPRFLARLVEGILELVLC